MKSLKLSCTSNGLEDFAHVWIFSAQTLTENCLSLQSEDKTVLFAVGSTLVNCTNSYDVEKPDAQMVELAKYAKQHVPEEHPKVQHSNYWLPAVIRSHRLAFLGLFFFFLYILVLLC